MKRLIPLFVLMILVGLIITACGDSSDEKPDRPSPTPPSPVASPTAVMLVPTDTPGGPTPTPSLTLPPTITPTQTLPPPPPTGTATPTETPGPQQYVVQAGDSCVGIAAHYGHIHPDVVAAIEALNGISCRSIQQGQTILVPMPTFTPTSIGDDLTQTAVATSAPPMVTLSAGASFSIQPYTVQEDDTVVSISLFADSSLRQLCELNPLPNGIDCSRCVWESPNCCCPGGLLVSQGQQINIPAPTPTPTFTPTFTGSETPTMTPTHRPPQPVYPLEGDSLNGPVRLSWLTVGPLAEGETYLVTVRDETTGVTWSGQTRQLSIDMPQAYLVPDGQTHTFAWQVSVAQLGSDGLFYPVGTAVPERRFTWGAGE